MIFQDRSHAGRQLAKRLRAYAGARDTVVLGIPRGGVPVAFEIAKALHLPLDIFLSRKLGVPGQEELAFGAVAAGGGRFLDRSLIRSAGIPDDEVERITAATRRLLDDRASLYRADRQPLPLEGTTVLLVDDGVATGASIFAGLNALKQRNLRKLVVAVPVAPASTVDWLRRAVDEFVVLATPENFYAVGQFYGEFPQVSDSQVIDLLRQAEDFPAGPSPPSRPTMGSSLLSATRSEETDGPHDVAIRIGSVTLVGSLTLTANSNGIVLFAHGSGSSRHSPRNRYVAEVLHARGLSTLLFDLLTQDEDEVDRQNASLRFDIDLLSGRLIEVTRWVADHSPTRHLPIGYFGASTGAAAALVAAAELPTLVSAVVSRGGRPDLAGDVLPRVHAPTLLIVGDRDEVVLGLNRKALARLGSAIKELRTVPGATHLFDEPGALEQAAQLAADWLSDHLNAADHRPLSFRAAGSSHES